MLKLLIIYFIVSVTLIIVAYKLYPFLNESNNKKLSTMGILLGSIVALVGIFLLIFQAYKLNDSIKLQSFAFSLEQRPYLHAILNPTASGSSLTIGTDIDDNQTLRGGGHLFLRNAGKIPASDIQAEYKVVSDELKDNDLAEYFDKIGEFPHITTVFPNQNDISVYLNPKIGKQPKLVYIWAKISYTGSDPYKRYWYLFSYLFSIKYVQDENDSTGKRIVRTQISLIQAFEDWDRNIGAKEPEYKEPYWTKYLSIADKKK
ncbi:MAG TPA: hypothetical protein VEF33_08050 [Syntrophales bacterium]|nr:hypothetical protein [Syntrophales bacterium]